MDENKTELVESLIIWVSLFVNVSPKPRKGFKSPVCSWWGCQREKMKEI